MQDNITPLLSIIPARGGSKGIKDKNLVPLNGIPMIGHTIRAAQDSGICDPLIISTDSDEIQKYCVSEGVQSMGLLPDHLTREDSKVVYTVKHEVEKFERLNNTVVKIVLLLQPTAPLRTGEDIRQAYEIFKNSDSPSLISCVDGLFAHPRTMYKEQGGMLTPFIEAGKTLIRRQDMEQVYLRNGAIYMTDRDYFMAHESFVSDNPALYEMPEERSANIDSPIDLEWAEFLIKRTEKK